MSPIPALLPWPVDLLACLVMIVLIVAFNSVRLRKKFGKTTTLADIRTAHPRAKVIWQSKKKDSSE